MAGDGQGRGQEHNRCPTQPYEMAKIWKAENYAGPEVTSEGLEKNLWILSRNLSKSFFAFEAQQAQKPQCGSFDTIFSEKLGHFKLILLLG